MNCEASLTKKITNYVLISVAGFAILIKMVPKVSVIIPHHNGPDILNACLNSVLQTRYGDFEIIVVDDRSSDNSIKIVHDVFPMVNLVSTSSNVGFGSSCNQGARTAKGDIFVFLNNDTIVEPNWLSELVNTMEEYDARLATPKILSMKNKSRVNAAGGICDILGVGWNRGNGCVADGQFDKPEMVFYGSACLAVRRDVWEETGGYDESYFMYMEDVDLCWRAKLLGYDTLYVSSSVIYHHWRESTKDPYFIVRYVFRNNLKTILKNYSTRTLLLILPLYGAIRLGELIFFLSRSRKTFDIMLSGVLWNVRSLTQILTQRRGIQKSRRIKDRRILKQMVVRGFELSLISKKVTHPLGPFLTMGSARNSEMEENN